MNKNKSIYKVFPQGHGDLYDVVRRGNPSSEPFWVHDKKELPTENLTLDEAHATADILNNHKKIKDDKPLSLRLIRLGQNTFEDGGEREEFFDILHGIRVLEEGAKNGL